MNADRDAALALIPVSRETQGRFDAFLDLFQLWQARTNLIAPSTLPQLWTRHIADSLQLLALAPHATTWIDIGSGGGFPGIVLACVLAEHADAEVHLVERNGKKAAFLREALRVSGGAGRVHQGDVCDCGGSLPAAIDVVTARAVAPLDILLRLASPWLSRGAKGLFMKGQDIADELNSATVSWDFAVQHHPSLTGPGVILEITHFQGPRPHRATRS